MKKFTLLITTIILAITTMAQAPAGINYQTVIRDGDGNILPDAEISLQMTIRSGAPDGEVVYQETHDVITNAFGLVNLVIGNGTPQSGTFADINWGDGEKYLETAIDLDGGGSYTMLGVTQFLSTPYSIFASNGVQSMTTAERDALQNPPTGMAIYNTTSNCLNYFNGTSWFETCGNCTPLPSLANAGTNQYFNDATISTNLEGNEPISGNGTWNIVSGLGGNVQDLNNPLSVFTGEHCETYLLEWSITNSCGISSDTVQIHFDTPPTIAVAGEDQIILDNTTYTTLEANPTIAGEGIWSIEVGQGGSFVNPSDPVTIFLGQQCEIYVLRWSTFTDCNLTFDDVEIQFGAEPTTSIAGDDQVYFDNTTTIFLDGNIPQSGIGTWSILSGDGGVIEDQNIPGTLFSGQNCETYTLSWAINTNCFESIDTVVIEFNNSPTTANAGTNQWNVPENFIILNGNPPNNGNGYWSIISGNGGHILNPSDPSSLLIVEGGGLFELKWTIYTECGVSFDNVLILFDDFECGQDFGDFRDGQTYGTVQIGDQCWMNQNLNIGERINVDENMTDNGIIEKYCYDDDPANCEIYGGLYQWDETMQYTNLVGAVGLCPDSWHIPSDNEWKILEGTVDSQYPIGDPEWSKFNEWRGFDAGKNLKTQDGWSDNRSGSDLFGFSALPGGYRQDASFSYHGKANSCFFWLSTNYSTDKA